MAGAALKILIERGEVLEREVRLPQYDKKSCPGRDRLSNREACVTQQDAVTVVTLTRLVPAGEANALSPESHLAITLGAITLVTPAAT